MKNLAVVPLKFGSRRMKLKNITPVCDTLTPSFVFVVRTLTQAVDKVILVVEEGYLHLARKHLKHYRSSDLMIVEAPYPIHGEGSTVQDVVKYAMSIEPDVGSYDNLFVAYPTAFNLTVHDIEHALVFHGACYSVMSNGDDAGCLYKMPMSEAGGGVYYDKDLSTPFFFGEHLVDINNQEDFHEAEKVHRGMPPESYF